MYPAVAVWPLLFVRCWARSTRRRLTRSRSWPAAIERSYRCSWGEFLYRPNREGEFLTELLRPFDGVLVSNFYAAYDSLVLRISAGDIDKAYVDEWAVRLGLIPIWDAIQQRLGDH